MAKTYTVEYIGTGFTYTTIFHKKSYVFKAEKPVAGIPEDVAAYLSGLKEDASTRARLLFNVTEDVAESILEGGAEPTVPKVRIGVKKPVKAGTETTDFGA